MMKKHKALKIIGIIVAAFILYVVLVPLPKGDYITEAQARQKAEAYLTKMAAANSEDDPYNRYGNWNQDSRLDGAVQKYDLRGQTSRYEFNVTTDGKPTGKVYVNADRNSNYVDGDSDNEAAVDPMARLSIGRALTPQDHAYDGGAAPYFFAMKNPDGTYTVSRRENQKAKTISSAEFWVNCKLYRAVRLPLDALAKLTGLKI